MNRLKNEISLHKLEAIVDEVLGNGNFMEKRVAVISNVTVNNLEVFIRKYGALNGCNIGVDFGNYDDVVNDAKRFSRSNYDYVIFIPFFDNIKPSFELECALGEESFIKSVKEDFFFKMKLALDELSISNHVLLLDLVRYMDAGCHSSRDNLDYILDGFNKSLRTLAKNYQNVTVVDLERVISEIGYKHAYDDRFYYKAKAPFTAVLFDQLARTISIKSRGFGMHFLKALVLDCDNTLWGGVIGEDLIDGIKLSPNDYPNNIFYSIQKITRNLANNGIVICLCSKNNPSDVDDVIINHPYMQLGEEHIVAKMVNWNDKPSNIRQLANSLNIGLDSIVFVDDSDFECEAVRSQLPEVRVYQVPKNLSDYPRLFQEIENLFLSQGSTQESKQKIEQYKIRAEAETLRASFDSQEDYLKSLGLKVVINKNNRLSVPRISELSQKSNQFNLTTNRYSESDITKLMDEHAVYSLHVSDKFGDSGLTGVVVVHFDKEKSKVHVDNFFMSCRVIGRGVEDVIWNFIFRDALEIGCLNVTAKYIASKKNQQVQSFYDGIGLERVSSNDDFIEYKSELKRLNLKNAEWIEVQYNA